MAVIAVAGLAFPTVAGASLSELSQKAGTAGCISFNGSGGDCAVAPAILNPASVVVSPDGTSAYVASTTRDAVVIFDRAADGTLTQKPGTEGCISNDGSGGLCADGKALDGAISVAVSSNGASVYVASVNDDAVAVFDRIADGTLDQKPGTAGCISDDGEGGVCAVGRGLEFVRSVAVSPDGSSLYVASDLDQVGIFNRAGDGTLSQDAGTAGCVQNAGLFGCADAKALVDPTAVTVSPDGASVYVTAGFDPLVVNQGTVAVFDRAAGGTLTQKAGTAGCVSNDGSGGECADGKSLLEPKAVAVSPDGASVYVGTHTTQSVAVFDRTADGTLNQKTGDAGCVSNTPVVGCIFGKALNSVRGVAVSPDGDSVYAASFDSSAVAVFDRGADGTLTQRPGQGGCISINGSGGACEDGRSLAQPTSVAVSPDSKSVYATVAVSEAVAVFDHATTTRFYPANVRGSTQWRLLGVLDSFEPGIVFNYGTRPLVPLMGDWDANGTRTAGTYEAGTFKLRNTNDSGAPDIQFAFGDPRGYPLAGDFNGDDADDVAVYRTGTWQIRLSTGATSTFSYGTGSWPATVPVAGDWNRDYADGIGVYTRATATWSLRQTPSAGAADVGTFVFGTPNGSYPVVGDWDRDGTETVGVKSTTDGAWSLRNSNTAGSANITFNFGLDIDLPLAWR